MNRREVIFGIGSLVPLLKINGALGQVSFRAASESEIQKLISGATELSAPPQFGPLLELVGFDYRSRRALITTIKERNIPASEAVLPGFEPVAGLMEEFGYPVVPPEYLIQPEIPRILPPVGKSNRENWAVIVFDIILEAIGLSLDEALLRGFLEERPDLNKLLEEIASSVTTGNWDDLSRLLDQLMGNFFDAEFLRQMAKLAGVKFETKLILKIATRLVPVVGWGYFIFSLILALKRNGHRFVA